MERRVDIIPHTRGSLRFPARYGYNFVQLITIQPNTLAFWTNINFDSEAMFGNQFMRVVWAVHIEQL